MPSEYAPPGSNPRMTKAQMRKYLREMRAVQEQAKKKLDPDKEKAERHEEIKRLEEKLTDIF